MESGGGGEEWRAEEWIGVERSGGGGGGVERSGEEWRGVERRGVEYRRIQKRAELVPRLRNRVQASYAANHGGQIEKAEIACQLKAKSNGFDMIIDCSRLNVIYEKQAEKRAKQEAEKKAKPVSIS